MGAPRRRLRIRQITVSRRQIADKGELADAGEAAGPFLRTLDAVHLVAATRIRGSLAAFVTYDKRLAAAAQEAALPALSPA